MIEIAVILLYLALLIASTSLLAFRAITLLQARSYLRLFGELFIPSLLLLVYGWFGIPVLLDEQRTYVQIFGISFQKMDLLLGFFYMSLAGLSYFVGFCAVTNGKSLAHHSRCQPSISQRRGYLIFVFALIVFDLIIRAQLVLSGQYISWMSGAKATLEGASLSPLAMLQNGISPLIVASVVYFAVSNKKWLIYLLFLAILLIIQGSRQTIAYSLLSGVLAYYILRPTRFNLRKFTLGCAAFLFVFYVSSAVVLEVRREFRSDMKAAMEDPVGFVSSVTTDALPNILTFQEREASAVDIGGASLTERTSLWASTFAAETRQIWNGYSYLPADFLLSELATPVPSVFWPGEKPSIQIGDVRLKWFGFTGRKKFDPGSTVFSAFFAYFGPVGVMIYGACIGIAIGWIANLLVIRFKLLGAVVIIGLVQFFNIFSNSYSGIIAGIRNSFICVFALYVIIVLARFRIRSGERKIERIQEMN